jgi:hypothetical protein
VLLEASWASVRCLSSLSDESVRDDSSTVESSPWCPRHSIYFRVLVKQVSRVHELRRRTRSLKTRRQRVVLIVVVVVVVAAAAAGCCCLKHFEFAASYVVLQPLLGQILFSAFGRRWHFFLHWKK